MMNDIKAGDVFVTRGNGGLSLAIRMAEKFWAADNEAKYNHAGIIVSEKGRTFESLNRIEHADISQYRGCHIFIVRHKKMNKELFENGYSKIIKLDGTIYPWWRLGLHLLHLAKYFKRSGIPVCSELVGMFENACGLRSQYWGLMPDTLADEWEISKHYDIVYEGVWQRND